MPQDPAKFANLGEAVVFFYRQFASPAPERFDRYLMATGGRHLDAIVKYRWNIELSEALLPSLQVAEFTLRNALHQAMSAKYAPDDGWWFDATFEGKPILQSRDRDKVETAKMQLLVANKRITSARLVSELSFGFWVELLNSSYSKPIVIPALGTTLSRLPTAKKQLGWLRDTYGRFRDLRSRISHLEPIFDRQDLGRLHTLAWETSYQIQPYFVYPLRSVCRFQSISQKDLREASKALLDEVRDSLFERSRRE